MEGERGGGHLQKANQMKTQSHCNTHQAKCAVSNDCSKYPYLLIPLPINPLAQGQLQKPRSALRPFTAIFDDSSPNKQTRIVRMSDPQPKQKNCGKKELAPHSQQVPRSPPPSRGVGISCIKCYKRVCAQSSGALASRARWRGNARACTPCLPPLFINASRISSVLHTCAIS